MAAAMLDHSDLGSFEGVQGGGVQQFLGVQYATLKDRLASPELKVQYQSPVDATKHGPSPPQVPTGFINETKLFIQQELPQPHLSYSDTDCLNLNITVPSTGKDIKKLPVLVWIHGGGYILGSNAWPQYDHARIVKLSASHGYPIIAVGIGFRQGFPALLTSKELRDAGYKSNNLLRDQRCAFEWVQKFIQGFGGDPENISVMGESAGAMAVTLHLLSEQKLFNRALATGGTFLLRGPSTPEIQEVTYQRVCTALGLTNLEPVKRIEELLKVDMDEAIEKIGSTISFDAVTDDDLIPSTPLTFASIADPHQGVLRSKRWLDSLMIGDCQFDASVLLYLLGHLKNNCLQTFPKSCQSTLEEHAGISDKILNLYNFSSAKGDDAGFQSVLEMINDVLYTGGTLAFASGFGSHSPDQSEQAAKTKVNVFFFNEANPWPGAFQGKASHVLDVAFLFQNFNEKLGEGQRKAAEGMALDVCRWMYGDKVWKEYRNVEENRWIRIYGPSSGTEAVRDVVDTRSKGSGRRKELMELAESLGEGGWDLLSKVVGNFISGRGGG